jgi:putative lipoic acid-binding regulatory protein
MKKTLQVLFCVAVLLFTFNEADAQKKKKEKKSRDADVSSVSTTSANTEQLLIKKWQFDGEFLKATFKKEAEKIRATNPEQADELDQQAEMMPMFAAMITMEYKAGGAMELGMMGEMQSGTWKLEDNNKTLVQTSSNGNVTRFTIKLITADKLQLENAEGAKQGEPMSVIQLIPAK